MKTKLFIFFVLLLFSKTFGQENYSYDFEKLSVADTIKNQDKINQLRGDSNSETNDNFVCDMTTKDGEKITALIKKEKGFWLAFDLQIYDSYNSEYNIVGFSENKQYLFINKVGDHSARQTAFEYKYCYVIDLKNNSMTHFQYFESMIYWDIPENDDSKEFITKEHRVSNSTILLHKNGFLSFNDFYSITPNDTINYDVIQSGEYEIRNQKLIKTAYYDANIMQMKPVKYMDKMAFGMTLKDLELVYPNSHNVFVGNKYGTCADDGLIGYDFFDENDKALAYVTIKENRINGLMALSPTINFGKININSTAEEIMKLYPKAKWRIGDLSNLEHIYIEDLDAELIFETDETNRVGKYEYDKKERDSVFKKLNRKNAKPNYIKVN